MFLNRGCAPLPQCASLAFALAPTPTNNSKRKVKRKSNQQNYYKHNQDEQYTFPLSHPNPPNPTVHRHSNGRHFRHPREEDELEPT